MDGMADFCEWTGVEGCCMGYFGFWVAYGISTSAGQNSGGTEVGKCWQVKVAEERVFMGHLECERE